MPDKNTEYTKDCMVTFAPTSTHITENRLISPDPSPPNKYSSSRAKVEHIALMQNTLIPMTPRLLRFKNRPEM